MMSEIKQIFIVGNSRSGTTMMGRILSHHTSIFTFKELHFFGHLWSSEDSGVELKLNHSTQLLSKLLCIQKYGFLNKKNSKEYDSLSVSLLKNKTYTALQIFKIFLKYESQLHNAEISCDQTPRNIFYIKEILDNFPNSKIINMVRDPRDVLLSQKKKWKRRYLGASSIPLKESIRSYFNYHPITMSKIWNSAISRANSFKHKKRIRTIYFEQLVLDPENVVSDLCEFLGVEFSKKMLKIPNIGSSNSDDKKQSIGFDRSKIGNWNHGGLSRSEIYICQKMCKENMRKNNYKLKTFYCIPLLSIISILSFPIKISISFILNFKRIRNMKELVYKRILNK